MRRLREEQGGWALVTALTLMTIMAVFSMATLAFVDTEQRQSAVGRQRDTAFNVAEAALNAQTFALGRKWPGQGGASDVTLRYPDSCTQASTDARCPSAATLTAMFSSPDAIPTATWSTTVRDNSGSTGAQAFWSDAMLATAPTYDANGDGRLWVRSESTVDGRRRAMVALVRTEPQAEQLPHAAVLAGRLAISNNGRKVLVDAQGESATNGGVDVRCVPTLGEAQACLGHRLGSGSTKDEAELEDELDIQIRPNVSQTGYAGGDAMSAEALARMRETAIANGTYYTTCPASLAGAVVFVESSASCSYTGNVEYNDPASPGVLIMAGGTLSLGGGARYDGVVYHSNPSRSTGNLVSIQGSARVRGGVLIDGNGGLTVGSSGGAKVNLVFDDHAYDAVQSAGGAGLVQNTWRQLR